MTGAGRIVLRPGRPDDLAAVAAIEKVSFTDPWPVTALRAELRNDRLRRPVVAERDGTVLGYLMAWSVVDELHVINVAVAAEARREGIGTLLLDKALAGARAEGCRSATLEVRTDNAAARSFYLRHGFAVTGRRPRYYRDGGDAVIMTCTL